jgi:hypothetical protein
VVHYVDQFCCAYFTVRHYAFAERNSVSQIDTNESDEEGKECGPQQRSPLKVDPAASDSDPVKMYHQEQYIDMRKVLLFTKTSPPYLVALMPDLLWRIFCVW